MNILKSMGAIVLDGILTYGLLFGAIALATAALGLLLAYPLPGAVLVGAASAVGLKWRKDHRAKVR